MHKDEEGCVVYIKEKVTHFEAKKGPKIRCIPQRWDPFSLMFDREKKNASLRKVGLWGTSRGTSLNMLIFMLPKQLDWIF